MKVYTCEKCAKGTAGCTKKSNSVNICPSFVSYTKAAVIEQQRKKLQTNQSIIPSQHLTYKPFANLFLKGN